MNNIGTSVKCICLLCTKTDGKNMKKNNLLFDILIALTILIISAVGIFYTAQRFDITVQNVYGDSVLLFGRGIYAYESAFKGPILVGTDLIMFVLAIMYMVMLRLIKHEMVKKLIKVGILTVFLYYVTSLAFGTMMNRLFIIYIFGFGLISFRLVYELIDLNYSALDEHLEKINLPKGIKVFLIIMGLSVSVWLSEIVILLINNRPSELIGMHATEPTYIMDLAIILPTCFTAAYLLKSKKAFGAVLAIMMLTLLSVIGMIVIAQNLTQVYFGIEIGLGELIVFVLSFVVLSGIAAFYVVRFLMRIQRQIKY